MAEHWHTLKFGEGAKDVAFSPNYVQAAGKNIKELRKLARVGRSETERLAIENVGKTKVVWGVAEEIAAQNDLPSDREGAAGASVAVSPEDAPVAVALAEASELDVERGLEASASADSTHDVYQVVVDDVATTAPTSTTTDSPLELAVVTRELEVPETVTISEPVSADFDTKGTPVKDT